MRCILLSLLARSCPQFFLIQLKYWTHLFLCYVARNCLKFFLEEEDCAVLSRSVASDSLRPHGLSPARLLCPWGLFRQEYWSRLPCPPPGDLLNPGTETRSPAIASGFFPSWATGEAQEDNYKSTNMLNINFESPQSFCHIVGLDYTYDDFCPDLTPDWLESKLL